MRYSPQGQVEKTGKRFLPADLAGGLLRISSVCSPSGKICVSSPCVHSWRLDVARKLFEETFICLRCVQAQACEHSRIWFRPCAAEVRNPANSKQ